MDDTIKASLAAINAREAGNAEGKTEGGEVPQEAPPQDGKPGRARDAAGKFAKPGVAAGTPGATEPAAPAVETPATEAPPADAPPATKHPEPPNSWNAAEKAEWAAMSESARAAIHRREQDFFKGIEQYKGKATHFDALHAVIAPHADIITSYGQTAVENVGNLLDWQRALSTGDDATKASVLLTIAGHAGIKPEQIVEALKNPPPPPVHDPRVDALSTELDKTRQAMSQLQMAPILSKVEAFFADSKNEWIKEPGVADRMLLEIQSGAAKSVEEAYDNACKLSGSVQAKIQSREREAQAKREKEEAKRKADQAAAAAKASRINVTPRGTTAAGGTTKRTMDDTIKATLAEIKQRG
jgi:hypothetical protein